MEVSSDHHHHPDSDNRGVVVKERYVGKNMLMLFIIFSSNLFTFLVATSIYSSCSLTSPILLAHLNNQDGEVDDITNDNDPIPISHSTSTNNDDLAAEYIAFTSPQLLPFGFSSNFDSDTIYPSAGSGCTQTQLLDDLRKYMTYPVNGSCPDDELLAQKLLLGGCEPLPRRRCHPAAPTHYVQPYPLPTSLWSTPSDASVVWTAYTCKNYDCLINRSVIFSSSFILQYPRLNLSVTNRLTAGNIDKKSLMIARTVLTLRDGKRPDGLQHLLQGREAIALISPLMKFFWLLTNQGLSGSG